MTPKTILFSLIVSALAACGSPPRNTGYFPDGLPRDDGRYVDRAWFDWEALSGAQISGVELTAVRGVGVSDVTGITLAEAITWLREGLQSEPHSSVIVGRPDGRLARLEVAVTELDPGSTTARFWAGEFGAGHAWVQVEATLKDSSGGATIGRMVQRTRISGTASFQNSRGEDSGPKLVRQMLTKAGHALRRELAEALGSDRSSSLMPDTSLHLTSVRLSRRDQDALATLGRLTHGRR